MTSSDTVPIVLHRSGDKWVPWIKFLLGDRAGDVIEDHGRTAVVPNSVVVADKFHRLTPDFLRAVQRDGTIGLYQISDEWYRADLSVYSSFAFVWREHYHSALDGTGILQLPVPPAALDVVTEGPRPEAVRSAEDRMHLWSWTGQLNTTRFSMLKHMRRAGPGAEFTTGTYDIVLDGGVPTNRMPSSDYLGLLAESVFSPCPMGNVHLDSFRVYESLEMGAIPIVEKRPWLDYFGGLLGDHPLPAVTSWSQAPALIGTVMAEEGAASVLQKECVEWWSSYKRRLRKEAAEQLEAARTGEPISIENRPLRNRLESMKHKNAVSLARRFHLVGRRFLKHGSPRHPEHRERAHHE